MNQLQILAELCGKTRELAVLMKTDALVTKALTAEQKTFVTENWRTLNAFLESPEGQECIQNLATAWEAQKVKPQQVGLSTGY